MSYTDWQEIVETAIEGKKKMNILEFGLGAGTKYLLDNFNFVFSYELIDSRDHTLISWYEHSVDEYKDYTNWKSEVVFWKDVNFKDYDPNISPLVLARIDELFETYNFDCVLVDGGYHVRGDIANYILNKFHTKFVIIHDTNYNYEVDGYERIILPENYETIKYTIGEGTYIFKNIGDK